MGKKKYIVIVVIILIIILGGLYIFAGKTLNLSDYYNSLRTWNKLKLENGDSYSYINSFQSWTGNYTNTIIEVEKGKPISRNYETGIIEYMPKSDGGVDIKNTKNDTYIENQDNLGTHKAGFSPITMDNIYRNCILNISKVSSLTNNIYFETDNSGILSTCGYVPKNCQDECFEGVEINNFKWIK